MLCSSSIIIVGYAYISVDNNVHYVPTMLAYLLACLFTLPPLRYSAIPMRAGG